MFLKGAYKKHSAFLSRLSTTANLRTARAFGAADVQKFIEV
jgi:hypothetical protein